MGLGVYTIEGWVPYTTYRELGRSYSVDCWKVVCPKGDGVETDSNGVGYSVDCGAGCRYGVGVDPIHYYYYLYNLGQ